MDLSSLRAASMPADPSRTIGQAKPLMSGSLGQESGEQASEELKDVFTEFVGQTLFGSMLASMRQTVGKPAYFHGGRTEEVFQKQLDQKIVEQLTEASAESIAEPMFELFHLQRR